MMTLYRYTYFFLIAAMTAVMAACSSDDDAVSGVVTDGNSDVKVPVKLHLSVAGEGNTNTRAWVDTPNATDDEMMNIWTVVAVYADGDNEDKVAFIHAAVPKEQKREIDDLVYLTPGRYRFYSFANMEPLYVMGLLGIPTTENTMASVDVTGTLGTASAYSSGTFADNKVYSLTWGSTSTTVTSANVAAKVVQVNGNGFNPMATDNGYGVKGIPMSNVQELAIDGSSDVDLIVVRMMAKIEIQLFNETGSEVTVQSVTLSDLTGNVDNNLKLLPNYTTASSANTMEYVHKDIQPNLNGTPAKVDYTYEVPTEKQTIATATYASGTPARTLTFYVNESATPTNPDGLFYLTLKLANGSTSELRYALINQNGKTTVDNNAWNYIARNDYRIIPIVIDDYKLELIPYDFPPIGVYPCSVKEIENDLYEMTFHDYGHFHLVPKVTKISTGATVPFGSPTGSDTHYWTLNTDFAGSWYTAATKGGAWLTDEQITSNGFYRNQTVTADGDEVGGVPVWYANDGTVGPQWDPAGGTDYNPFIFGYIAEPDAEWWAASPRTDRQVYHEFRVKLFVGGTYRRDLIYRFYMTLSKDQMLGSRSLTPMSRKRH